MAGPPFPPAGIIPAGLPTIARLWRCREEGNIAFRHIKDLISCLYFVASGVFEDPDFLERSVLVDGVTCSTSPQDLLEIFSLLAVEAAVVVRDSKTGYRVGLVVFVDATDSTSATNLTPRPIFYATCIPASSHGDPRRYIMDALNDALTRRPSVELLRSLLPPQYLLDGKDKELHLRCVFVRGVAGSTAGGSSYGLCCVARDHLLARGYVCAVVAWRGGDAGVLVYDDMDTTELLTRRAPRLLVRSVGLQMQDSSLLPLLPNEADREASLLRRLLPSYITQQQQQEGRHERRVMVLAGIDTELWRCDAAEIAYILKHRVDLHHEVEAVIVHRALGRVVVVLEDPEDAEVVLQEPPETWLQAFGQQATWASVCVCPPPPLPQSATLDDLQLRRAWHLVGHVAYNNVAKWIAPGGHSMNRDDEATEIIYCLIGLCALAKPATVWSSSFPERSLLLSGFSRDTTWWDLGSRLSTFGVEDVVYDDSRGIALVVFTSLSGADRLRGEPAEAWNHLGFTDCRRVPGVDDTHVYIAQAVVDRLIQYRSPGPSPSPH